jgi:predicted ATPase
MRNDSADFPPTSGPKRITSLRIQGYRPFGDFLARLGPLEVIVGANASGKSSLFEFLKFLRDSSLQEFPPEIVAGSIGQQIFHQPGPERFWWSVEIDLHEKKPLWYQGQVTGPIGQSHVSFERVQTNEPFPGYDRPLIFMDVKERRGVIRTQEGALRALPSLFPPNRTRGFIVNEDGETLEQLLDLLKPTQLVLSMMTNPTFPVLYNLREHISRWRFYSAFNIAQREIRKSVPIAQEPVLYEDGSNLSSVLFHLSSEHAEAFMILQQQLRAAIPGFRGLSVKARGGPGEVIAFWQEEGVEGDLSLADLSDGVLRFLCWAALCLHPDPPTLICIDEPDQGVHPRTLPVLAGLFRKASERTQLLLATHASYFLAQFPLEQIAVMKKEGGESKLLKPADSAALRDNLEEFGNTEIELMHQSDELEILA